MFCKLLQPIRLTLEYLKGGVTGHLSRKIIKKLRHPFSFYPKLRRYMERELSYDIVR